MGGTNKTFYNSCVACLHNCVFSRSKGSKLLRGKVYLHVFAPILIILIVIYIILFNTRTPDVLEYILFKWKTAGLLEAALKDTNASQKYSVKSIPFQRKHIFQGCDFPSLDPFDPKISKFVHTIPPVDCTGNIPRVVDVSDGVLRVDPRQVKAKLKSGSAVSCKYRSIRRVEGDDFRFVHKPWSRQFSTSIDLAKNESIFQVDCESSGRLVSRSYNAVARKIDEIEEKRREDYKQHVKKNSPSETLSLLLIGIDGVAKANFIRSMPKTRDFLLNKLNAIEFQRFNKVGLNTFPNMLPLFTGMHEEEFEKYWDSSKHFDEFDEFFIWNLYQKAGYRTAVVLDDTHITAFHYLKKGWSKPPFDFYPRPLMLASKADDTYNKLNCMGDSPQATEILDYSLQIATLYNNTPSTPYFAFSFLATLTHDDLNMASAGDGIYLRFFQELASRSVLNNTLLIFFSDHGERFGAIRNTYQGTVEAKLPFLYFIFPPWFESKYRTPMKIFRKNTNRLLTMFDIHATLKELLNFSGKPQHISPVTRSISLFSEIPSNRTCRDAAIPTTFCACTSLSSAKNLSLSLLIGLAEKLVDHVVQKTKWYRSRCQVLTLKEIVNVMVVKPEIPLKDKSETLHQIVIKLTPGDGVFEALLFHNAAWDYFQVLGDVTRLNMYKGQAKCLNDFHLRPFCYCI